MKIKEEWFVQFRTYPDETKYPLGTYSTVDEAKEAIHRIQKIDPNSHFYMSKIEVTQTLTETFYPLRDVKKYDITPYEKR